jgi:hypothetical protein
MKKLSIIILSVSFAILALGVSLFFYFRNKNNTNSEQNDTGVTQKIDETVEENENKPNNEKQNVDNSGEKSIETRNITIQKLTHYEQFDDKLLKIKIEVEYPVISNENHSNFIDKINKENKLEAEKEFNKCKLDLKQTAESMMESGNPLDDTLYYVEECEITRNNSIISMAIKGGWYAGGTHDVISKTKNYDLKNSKELTLKDVLNGSKKNIDKMITEKIKKYLGNNHDLYNEYFQEYDLKDYKFHIENKNSQDILIIDFSKYEVSDGAAGAISIEIPFSEIKQKYKIGLKI